MLNIFNARDILVTLSAILATAIVMNALWNKALDECIEDVTKGCKNVIAYASDLEDENHRLRNVIAKMRQER